VKNLYAEIRCLVEFIGGDAVMGQEGFALATLETAINYLTTLDLNPAPVDDTEEDPLRKSENASSPSSPTVTPTKALSSNLSTEIQAHCRNVFGIKDESVIILDRFSCVYPGMPHSTYRSRYNL
jgi:hypothetical protein